MEGRKLGWPDGCKLELGVVDGVAVMSTEGFKLVEGVGLVEEVGWDDGVNVGFVEEEGREDGE